MLPEVVETPSRFRNTIGKYIIKRSSKCKACGKCADICPYGVHIKPGNYSMPLRPIEHKCIGSECSKTGHFCIDKCPENALTLKENPLLRLLGITGGHLTCFWVILPWQKQVTDLMSISNMIWVIQAVALIRYGLYIRMPAKELDISDEDIDTSIELNKTGDGRPKKTISIPCYGGGMSYGSTALSVIVGRARAAKKLNSLTSTGEGGYPPEFLPYKEHVITQVATGLFGVKEETIKNCPVMEFKYAQGAKPGLGGHLLGEKVTEAVAAMRETVVGSSLFSPFPFHSVYSVEDHKKHVDWIKEINHDVLCSVKVSTPTDVDMVAVGAYYAGAHIIHIDGSYGGTGAAPDIAKKNIAMPIEYAIPKVHNFLKKEGIRDKICLIASGGIRNGMDVAKAIALGADGCVIGTADLVAVECVRCGKCESGRGCARGIATTDPELGNHDIRRVCGAEIDKYVYGLAETMV